MKKSILALFLCALSAQAAVTVTSPSNNITLVSPVHYVATATAPTCSKGVSSMGIYVNNVLKYTVQGNKLNTQLAFNPGTYSTVVQEWDHCGGATKTAIQVNISYPELPVIVGAVTINAPNAGTSVTSPFILSAVDLTCGGQIVQTMGYSVDNATTNLSITNSTGLGAVVSLANGPHVLHVKSWGPQGSQCMTSVAFNVVQPAISVVPANAEAVNSIQSLSTWQEQHDPATGATSSGNMSVTNEPSLSGFARQYVTQYTNGGGELYWTTLSDDATSTNFFYDGWVYLPSPSTNVANVELDFDQVMSNGQTVIFGFQCDGYNSTWDYNEQSSTASNSAAHWIRSSQACNPRAWTTDTWHHVQIYYSRDSNGNATYHSVWLDNVEQDINATVYDAFALNWSQTILTNFQIDGVGASGTAIAYLDNLTIYRW